MYIGHLRPYIYMPTSRASYMQGPFRHLNVIHMYTNIPDHLTQWHIYVYIHIGKIYLTIFMASRGLRPGLEASDSWVTCLELLVFLRREVPHVALQ